MRNHPIEVQPIAGALGAEIHGVDVSQDLPEATVAAIRGALNERGVIFFRDQTLDKERHKAFARRFGPIFIHPNFNGTGPDPEALDIVREPGDKRIVGEGWHTDATMVAEPPMAGILYGAEIPPYGGDTMFASQTMAYDTLSDAMKRMLGGLRAVHSDIRTAGPQAARNKDRATKVREDANWRVTMNTHPVVCTHPETSRKYLFVNASYTQSFEGMTEEESKPLLDFLYGHSHRPEFTCRFRWEPGSIAFWDNRCTKHLAIHDAGPYRRVMRRIQVSGGRPV